jgi:hypothetical protein
VLSCGPYSMGWKQLSTIGLAGVPGQMTEGSKATLIRSGGLCKLRDRMEEEGELRHDDARLAPCYDHAVRGARKFYRGR